MIKRKWLWVALGIGIFFIIWGIMSVLPVTDQLAIWKQQYDTSQRMNKPQLALVTRVIDGDTIELATGERVRYIGIDSPDKDAIPDGAIAKAKANMDFATLYKYWMRLYYDESVTKNSELVLNKTIKMLGDIQDKDVYGRLLRYIWVDDVFVNAELVRLGFAIPASYPPNTRYEKVFQDMKQYAKSTKAGMFKTDFEKDIIENLLNPKQTQAPRDGYNPFNDLNSSIIPFFRPNVKIQSVTLPYAARVSSGALVYNVTFRLVNNESTDKTVNWKGNSSITGEFDSGKVTVPKNSYIDVTRGYHNIRAGTERITYNIYYVGTLLDTWSGTHTITP